MEAKNHVLEMPFLKWILDCVRNPGKGVMECCPGMEGPNVLYGPAKKCCPGGQIVPNFETCPPYSYGG